MLNRLPSLNSLSTRLAASLLFILMLGVTATAGYFYWEARRSYEIVRARTLHQQARELMAGITATSADRVSVRVSPEWQKVYSRTGSGFYYTIYSSSGKVLAVSPNLRGKAPLPLGDPPTRGRIWGDLQFLGPNAEPTTTARLPAGDYLAIARSGPDEEALIKSLLEERTDPAIVLVPLAFLALVLILLITRRALEPLKTASKEAAEIGPHNLGKRIAAHRMPVEIKPLVDAFNAAMDRVAGSYELERRITANAAHELRTPLAVLSLRLQRTRLGTKIDWVAIEADLARMSRLVSQLLDLARKEALHSVPDEDVNLSRLVREAAAAVLPLAEANQRSIRVKADEPLPSRGASDDLRDMFRNLIENAIIHGEGTVTVNTKKLVTENGPTAFIAIADEGRSLPQDANETLFERFRKASTDAGGGAGLGLSIVRHVAHLHGGVVRFVSETPCTTVEVSLPLRGLDP